MVLISSFSSGTPSVSVADDKERRSCSMILVDSSGPPPTVLHELIFVDGLPYSCIRRLAIPIDTSSLLLASHRWSKSPMSRSKMATESREPRHKCPIEWVGLRCDTSGQSSHEVPHIQLRMQLLTPLLEEDSVLGVAKVRAAVSIGVKEHWWCNSSISVPLHQSICHTLQ